MTHFYSYFYHIFKTLKILFAMKIGTNGMNLLMLLIWFHKTVFNYFLWD